MYKEHLLNKTFSQKNFDFFFFNIFKIFDKFYMGLFKFDLINL